MQRHRSSATPLAVLYAALIVYASLYPFAGWRMPGQGVLDFVAQPWSRWWTGFDLIANLVGYVPLGGLAFVASVRSGQPAMRSWLLGTLVGAGLSLAMETLQNFLPPRIPSNVDLGLNIAGALLGASFGALVHAKGGVARWQTVRDRWFTQRSAGGIALLIAWPLALFFPLPLPLGVGQMLARVREGLLAMLQDTSFAAWAGNWLAAEPAAHRLGPGAEWLVVAFGLLAPCLIAYSITLPGWRRPVLAVLLSAVGVFTTALSTALNFGPQHAFAWATPRSVSALAAALSIAVALTWLARRAVSALGLVALTALIVLVTLAPADPYFAQSLQAWEQGRFIRFHGASQWIGWLWPYAALGHLLAMTSLRADRVRPSAPP